MKYIFDLMLFYFQKSKNALQVTKKICLQNVCSYNVEIMQLQLLFASDSFNSKVMKEILISKIRNVEASL